ncbi:hypothetical protein ACLK1S_06980 [Escherichia coli]
MLKRGFNNFIYLISPDELAGLATESELTVDWSVTRMANGRSATARSESHHYLGETNWSLLVQAVNHWHEPTAALTPPFRDLPDWRIL